MYGDRSGALKGLLSCGNNFISNHVCLFVGRKTLTLAKQYLAFLNGQDFITEIKHLLSVHKTIFGCAQNLHH